MLTTITTPYEKMPHPQISTESKYLISDFHLLSRSFRLMMEETTTAQDLGLRLQFFSFFSD
jgi:hypothetical protein